MEIRQKLKVVGSDKEGCVVIIQTMPFDIGREYRYEVPIEHLEATIKELEARFKHMVEDILRGFNKDEEDKEQCRYVFV